MKNFNTFNPTDIYSFPKNWKKFKFYNLFSTNKDISKNIDKEVVLSLTKKGLVVRDLESNKGQIAGSYDKYTKVIPNDIVFNPMDLISGWVDVVNETGVVSPSYLSFRLNENQVNPLFILYLFQLQYLNKMLFNFGKGVATHDGFGRWSINEDTILKTNIFLPDIETQNIIVKYLEQNTKKIDKLVEKIQKKIVLLKAQRNSLINHYVLKGLDPNVEMKDSGDRWMGDIPKHWELIKLKYLVSYNQETLSEATDPDYEIYYIEIGDVDYIDGISINNKIRFSESPSRARRVVQPNDVIISTVRTYLRSIGVVPDISNVVCSTGFCVLRDNTGLIEQKFLSFAVKSEWFVSNVISNSYGVSYPAINSSEIIQLKIALPPKNEQLDIIDFLDSKILKIDQNIRLEEKRISLLNEYRNSLILSVVTGEHTITREMV
tara:strand:+ start:11579 stop:12877 length:1299 start_codon:yes stop_codon:yes gene_type:complete